MEHYKPEFYVEEASKNIRGFVKANNDKLWDIFIPLIPFIFGLNLLDALVTGLYFPNSRMGFMGGELLATYFTMVLVISWHRVVINGPDHYVPMNPFKPQKHELGFIGMGLALWALIVGVAYGVSFFLSPFGAGITLLVLAVSVIVLAYVSYRLCFYFPAKAIDKSITLEEAYAMSNGYLLKIIFSSILASLRVIALAILASIVTVIIVKIAMPTSQTPSVGNQMAEFAKSLPMMLYFQPILSVIGVTAISNYYMWAKSNQGQIAS
tara:strand:- start:25202 stop:25999 length:798 start_codon:yes stop_codon:yes gene_type:complete